MKLSHLQENLKNESLDLAILMDPDPSLVYLSQNIFSHAIMAITSQKAITFVSKLDKIPKVKGMVFEELNKDWVDNLFKKKSKIKRIGINKEFLSVKNLESLEEKFPGAEFLDLSSKLSQLREQKTDLEIKKIEKACQITVKAFNFLVKELSKGDLKTEQDVALFLEKKIRQGGAKLAFPTIVACGENAAIPHHCTSNTKLKEGFLLMDFGAKFQNYCADMTRVVFLGTAKKEDKEIYNLLLSAQKEAINSIQESVSFQDLDKVVRKKLSVYSEYFIHSLGHGIGIEVHENPVFSNKKSKVQKNVPFTIEPGIYLPGKLGLRIEDTIIFDEKVKILTNATKELVEIDWKQ